MCGMVVTLARACSAPLFSFTAGLFLTHSRNPWCLFSNYLCRSCVAVACRLRRRTQSGSGRRSLRLHALWQPCEEGLDPQRDSADAVSPQQALLQHNCGWGQRDVR